MVVRPEDIYEGLFSEEAFARLPALLAEAADARASIVQWRKPGADFEVASSAGFADAALEAYSRQWRSNDPWARAAMSPLWVNQFFIAEEAVPQEEFTNSPFYNDFLKPEAEDTFHCMGAGFSTPWGHGLFGLTRRRRDRGFTPEDLARFRPFARMANDVLRVRGEAATAKRSTALARTSLDALALGVLTTDGRGRILSRNEAADRVLARGDGLIARAGSIDARFHAEASDLRLAISRAAAPIHPQGSSLQVSRSPDRAPYLITASPAVGHSVRGRSILIFADPDYQDPWLVERLRDLFGLTPAEASIAAELGKGRSLDQIGFSRGVQWNTLRSQLKGIMAKTGCGRQAEIAALVASLPVVRAY